MHQKARQQADTRQLRVKTFKKPWNSTVLFEVCSAVAKTSRTRARNQKKHSCSDVVDYLLSWEEFLTIPTILKVREGRSQDVCDCGSNGGFKSHLRGQATKISLVIAIAPL